MCCGGEVQVDVHDFPVALRERIGLNGAIRLGARYIDIV
jgi:hypothetical protein